MYTTDLVPYNTLVAMEESYRTAQREITEAFTLLDNAKKRLNAAFDSNYMPVVPQGWHDYDLPGYPKQVAEKLKRDAWLQVIKKTQIKNLLSDKRNRELDAQIEKGDIPNFTAKIVLDTLEKLTEDIPSLLRETVKEAYNYLHPYHTKKKTNPKFELGKKVILDYAVDTQWGVYLTHNKEAVIRSIDNAFHLLAGKGPVKYPSDAVTAINTAIQNKEWSTETEFFSLKWYKLGSMHIKFKRIDLVDELNKMAGDGTLKTQQ